jgi:dTDP-4-amino-4,6-dideoxygalactose transaminase
MGFAEGALPITEAISHTIISLPMGPHMSDDQIQYVAKIIGSICAELA